MKMRILLLLFYSLSLHAAAVDWREAWDAEPRQRWLSKPEAELRKEANAGGPMAMWMLAVRLYNERSNTEAKQWRDKAASAEVPQAMTEVAHWATFTNLQMAIPLLEKAAATGYPIAKANLARILVAGRTDPMQFEVKPNPGRAVELLQQALDERAVEAWMELATLYAAGVGEPRNDGETPVRLFARAANSGNVDAMNEMARRRRIGYGVEKDLLSSATWAARARLKHFFRYGGLSNKPTDWVGADEGPDETILRNISNLYAEAFEKESVKAILELASMSATGQHGAPNLPRAAALYTLAERAGETSAAAERRELESKFTAEEREALQFELRWMTGR